MLLSGCRTNWGASIRGKHKNLGTSLYCQSTSFGATNKSLLPGCGRNRRKRKKKKKKNAHVFGCLCCTRQLANPSSHNTPGSEAMMMTLACNAREMRSSRRWHASSRMG